MKTFKKLKKIADIEDGKISYVHEPIHSENGYTAQINPQDSNVISIRIPIIFSTELKKQNHKTHMEEQKAPNSQSNSKKKKTQQGQRHDRFDLKLYYRATGTSIRKVQKNRHVDQHNRGPIYKPIRLQEQASGRYTKTDQHNRGPIYKPIRLQPYKNTD